MLTSKSASVISGAATTVVKRPLCAVFDFAGHGSSGITRAGARRLWSSSLSPMARQKPA